MVDDHREAVDAERDADTRLLEAALEERSIRLAAALEDARTRRRQAEHLEARLARVVAQRDKVGRDLEQLRGHFPVRAWLRICGASRRVAKRAAAGLGAARGHRPYGPGERRLRATGAEERGVRERILATLPADAPVEGPRVSIVVLNRNGIHHLRLLFPALARTAYRNVDITLVDNASDDGSAAWAKSAVLPFPIRIIENAENESFSAANNAAVHDATGELVLLLNNDVVPIEPHWLGRLVAALEATGAAAAGARLVIPRRSGPRTGPANEPADLDLQHAGITFRWIGGVPRPRNVGGRDAADPSLARIREVPAATAACLLVRRERFLAVGGFDERYVYGYEDVDLALRLRDAGGRIIVDGRAVLWHDESATRRTQVDKATRRRQGQNLQEFNGSWGVRLFREALREALSGEQFLTSDPPGITFFGAADPDVRGLLVDLGGRGWQVHHDVPGASRGGDTGSDGDAGLVALVGDAAVDVRELPPHAVTVGWVGERAETWVGAPWFNELDIVLVPDATTREAVALASSKRPFVLARLTAPGLLSVISEWLEARRFAILVQALDWHEAPISGDYHFARALQRQLERQGIPTSVHLRPAWTQGRSARDDVAIHLWGRNRLGPRRGQTTVLWVLFHPELVTEDLLDAYDLVAVASDRFAAQLAPRTARPVRPLHQATDPERFRPGRPGPPHELLFVGNSRGVRRRILDDLTPTAHDLAVYGRGWDPELLDPAYLRGDRVPNEALGSYYQSAAIVLNDHWPESAEAGFINNRLYDALAAGAFVISDHVDGIEDEFDGGVVTYRDVADLRRLVERYLVDPAGRAAIAARGHATVVANHTFEQRVEELLGLLDELGTQE